MVFLFTLLGPAGANGAQGTLDRAGADYPFTTGPARQIPTNSRHWRGWLGCFRTAAGAATTGAAATGAAQERQQLALRLELRPRPGLQQAPGWQRVPPRRTPRSAFTLARRFSSSSMRTVMNLMTGSVDAQTALEFQNHRSAGLDGKQNVIAVVELAHH